MPTSKNTKNREQDSLMERICHRTLADSSQRHYKRAPKKGTTSKKGELAAGGSARVKKDQRGDNLQKKTGNMACVPAPALPVEFGGLTRITL